MFPNTAKEIAWETPFYLGFSRSNTQLGNQNICKFPPNSSSWTVQMATVLNSDN